MEKDRMTLLNEGQSAARQFVRLFQSVANLDEIFAFAIRQEEELQQVSVKNEEAKKVLKGLEDDAVSAKTAHLDTLREMEREQGRKEQDINRDLGKIRTDGQRQIEKDLKDERTEAEAAVRGAKAEAVRLKAGNEAKAGEVKILEDRITSLQRQHDDLQEEVNDLRALKDKHQRAIAESLAKLEK